VLEKIYNLWQKGRDLSDYSKYRGEYALITRGQDVDNILSLEIVETY
jgi:hypothetical protein